MLEVMAALLTYQGQGYLTTGVSPRRRGNQHPSIVPYEVFEAADGYLTVGVANNSLWTRFCQGIGHPELATDARFDTEAKRVERRDVLVPLLGRRSSGRPRRPSGSRGSSARACRRGRSSRSARRWSRSISGRAARS